MEILAGIDQEKRDRIINAAIQEFAEFPYDKASTNNIVQNAGISKGLLFHYFNSKQSLYEQLIGFVTNKIYHAVSDRINWSETDLFERMKQLALAKLEISRTYPHMFDFLLKMLAYKKAGKIEEIIELYKGYGIDFQQVINDIYTRNVDYTRFRDPATIAETINIVRWSLEKYGEEQLQRLGTDARTGFAEAAAGMDRYMDILKHAFYKEQQPQGGPADDHG